MDGAILGLYKREITGRVFIGSGSILQILRDPLKVLMENSIALLDKSLILMMARPGMPLS